MNHEFKQTKKKKTPRYQQLFKTSGEGRKGTGQANTANTIQGPSSKMMWVWLAYRQMWVWFAHAHKNYIPTSNKKFILKCTMMEKEQKQNWDGGYLYYPFLHSNTVNYNNMCHMHACTQCTVECRNG